jgi:hypothetical protein
MFPSAPVCDTPTIHSFPPGFNYPLPRSWPICEGPEEPHDAPQWGDVDDKGVWRAFGIVVRELARNHHHHIRDLSVDVRGIQTGLGCGIFNAPCGVYDNLVAVLKRPGFARLDLALLADVAYDQSWSSLRSGHLKRALGEANLQHFGLCVEARYDQLFAEDYAEHHVPLRVMLPVEKWQSLRHCSLSRLIIRADDLLSTLAELPRSSRSVVLSFVIFVGARNHHDLLNGMREDLDWRGRMADEHHPLVEINAYATMTRSYPCWYKSVKDDVAAFLYGDAVNPFQPGSSQPLLTKGVRRLEGPVPDWLDSQCRFVDRPPKMNHGSSGGAG